MSMTIDGIEIGDAVELTSRHDYWARGSKGVVRGFHKSQPTYAAVELEKDEGDNGHDCDGIVPGGQGFYVPVEKLKVLTKKIKKVIVEYKPGTSVSEFVKKLLGKVEDKERLKWLRTFDNCVLPKKVRDMIDEALTIILRSDIFEKWGINEHFEKGLTNSIMLWGPPGTGKTMVSESIAAVLGKNLMKIDNSNIQSNIPGKTEKNIKESFKKAKDNDAVMLIDECDSLLYERDAVGAIMSSHINCLLSEIENYDGVCILTTNRLHKLDGALQRRVIAKIELPLPDKKARNMIWQKLVPEKMPLEKDVDFKELAEAELSGGEIKNGVILAARKAIAQNKKSVSMTHFQSVVIQIVEGKMEYEKRRPKRVRAGADYDIVRGGG